MAANQATGKKIDSLHHLLHSTALADSTRINLLAEVANEYRAISPDSIFHFAQLGIDLANKTGYDHGKARCLVAKTLANLILGQYDSAMVDARNAISIFESTKDTIGLSDSYYYLAAATYSLSKYHEAIEYYKKTVAISDKPGNEDRVGDALDNIGISYSTVGNFSESLKYYLEGLKVRERTGDAAAIATSLGNIGRVYASLGDKKKAFEFINRSLEKQRGSPPQVLMLNYENAGNVYLTAKDTVAALNVFKEALSCARAANMSAEYSRIMVNTAEVLLDMSRVNEAENYYNEAVELGRQVPNMPAVDAMIHRGLGRIYSIKGRHKEAITELKKAFTMLSADGMTDHANETTRNLATAYGRAGDYENAYRTLMEYYTGRDSIMNEETQEQGQQLQYEYDLWKKEAEIKLLEKDKAIAQSRAEKQNAVSLGLGAVLLLSIILIIMMYGSRQRAKRAQRKITEQAATLSVLNNYKDKIFSVISHDMRSPITALDTSLAMLDENVISPGEFAELKAMLHRQLASVSVSLDNLLKWAASNIKGKRTLKKERVEIAPLVLRNLALMQYIADEKRIKIENEVSPSAAAMADAGDIDVIARNLLSNALKFTPSGGVVQITTTRADGKLLLTVKDTGIGMDAERLGKLFSLEHQLSTSGTAGEQGMGIGLLMSTEFAKANGGAITAESTPGEGSAFTLELPAA
ncbi:MAG: tetratricopeptide repeat-containing sensor histidine kinase [Taibaiella sp.]|nr:tetratricopeptide repeat-containing sensor histidine kinase [Taibaiella sp.]